MNSELKNPAMRAKKVSETRYTMQHRVFISELNSVGTMHGGYMLRYLDEAAAICGTRHARCKLVTVAVEQAKYIAPIYHGEVLLYHCSVNHVSTSSMEVGVRVEAENLETGERRHTNTAYLTFVALDGEDRPRPLPPLEPETDEDRRRMADAARRMALSRMERRLSETNQALYLHLERVDGLFALCRLAPDSSLPLAALTQTPEASGDEGSFFSLSRSEQEISLILPQKALSLLPQEALVEKDFACLRVMGSFSMNVTGLLSTLSFMLAAAQIPVFLSSTFTTAYLLVRASSLEKAVAVLRSAGHSVEL